MIAAELCSQSTISRLENLPDIRTLLRLGVLIHLYCASFRRAPRRITLDIDDTGAGLRSRDTNEERTE
jgi:hypothetical protein